MISRSRYIEVGLRLKNQSFQQIFRYESLFLILK